MTLLYIEGKDRQELKHYHAQRVFEEVFQRRKDYRKHSLRYRLDNFHESLQKESYLKDRYLHDLSLSNDYGYHLQKIYRDSDLHVLYLHSVRRSSLIRPHPDIYFGVARKLYRALHTDRSQTTYSPLLSSISLGSRERGDIWW